MENKIHFYHHPWTRGGTVHWMLEELGLPYQVTLLDYTKGEQKSPSYLAINPMGKIPAITHNGIVITEAAAICVYLADQFPIANLAPKIGDDKRGPYLRWIFFAASCTEPALVDKRHSRPPVDPSSNGYGSFEAAFANLEMALKPGPFLLGEVFSAADVYIASQLSWGLMTKGIAPTEVFERYVQICKDRPAYQRYLAQSKEMLQKLQTPA